MPSFGAQLKKERERQGISLEDISVSTKISLRMLRALEEENFNQLPGGIFNKGFIRAYARHVGMDEDQAVAEYLKASGEAAPENPESAEAPVLLPEIQSGGEGRGIASIPWGILAAALVLVAIGFAMWGQHSRNRQNGSSPEKNAAEAVTIPATPATHRTPQAVAPQTNPQTLQNVSASSSAPAKFAVEIRANDECWVSIRVDGKEAVEYTLEAEDHKSVEAQSQVVIKTGNAGGLRFLYNGQPVPQQGEPGEVKTVTFDAKGLTAPDTAKAVAQ